MDRRRQEYCAELCRERRGHPVVGHQPRLRRRQSGFQESRRRRILSRKDPILLWTTERCCERFEQRTATKGYQWHLLAFVIKVLGSSFISPLGVKLAPRGKLSPP
jgi:hypothetical protein